MKRPMALADYATTEWQFSIEIITNINLFGTSLKLVSNDVEKRLQNMR